MLFTDRLDVAKKVVVLLAKAAQANEDAAPLRPDSLPCDVYLDELSGSTQPERAAQGQPLFDETAEAQAR